MKVFCQRKGISGKHNLTHIFYMLLKKSGQVCLRHQGKQSLSNYVQLTICKEPYKNQAHSCSNKKNHFPIKTSHCIYVNIHHLILWAASWFQLSRMLITAQGATSQLSSSFFKQNSPSTLHTIYRLKQNICQGLLHTA